MNWDQDINAPLPDLEVLPPLLAEIIELHNEKDAAYGDSWCRRGELIGIMANIARKVDRLGGKETGDESSLDTAMDLFVYLAKYFAWTHGQTDALFANKVMAIVVEETVVRNLAPEHFEEELRNDFAELEVVVQTSPGTNNREETRAEIIQDMLINAWNLVNKIAGW